MTDVYEDEVIEPGRKEKKNDEYYLEPERPRRRRWPWFMLAGCLLTCCACCGLVFATVSIGGAVIGAVFEANAVVTGSDSIPLEDVDAATFEINNQIGDVEIEVGEAGQITVDYVKKAYGINESQAREQLDKVEVNLRQDGDRILLDVVRDDDNFTLARVDSVDLTITVPEDVLYAFEVDGDIGALRIGRDVRVSALDADMNVGDIEFRGAFEDLTDSRIRTRVGEIDLSLSTDLYAEIDAESSVGAVEIDDAFGPSEDDRSENVTGRSWQVVLGEGDGAPPLLELRTDVGDISVNAQ